MLKQFRQSCVTGSKIFHSAQESTTNSILCIHSSPFPCIFGHSSACVGHK